MQFGEGGHSLEESEYIQEGEWVGDHYTGTHIQGCGTYTAGCWDTVWSICWGLHSGCSQCGVREFARDTLSVI